MEQFSNGSFSRRFEGTTKIRSTNTPKQEGNGAWRIPLVSDASLFSSSLPVLSHQKLNFGVSAYDGQSVDDASPNLDKLHRDVEANDSLDDLALHAIGSLLPDDEDDLLAGIMDDFDLTGLPNQLEDLDESDFFGSGGGMELDFDPTDGLSMGMSNINIGDGTGGNGASQYGFTNGVGAVTGEHPFGEHPSRTLFVRNINSNVEDSELRTLFEQYGDIRTLYTACKHRGFVMISYYDIRAARTSMRALQNKPLRRRKLDIHFSIPKDNPSDKDMNQGTLVVFNLDPSVSNDDLRQIFGAYGEVKEIRETPHKRHHKFIEFYDVRAAEAALRSLNRSDIAGKRIKLEPSRPGGARRNLLQQLTQELEQDETRSFRVGSPIASSPPGNWAQISSPVDRSPLQSLSQSPGLGNMSPINGNHLPGLASFLAHHLSNSVKIAPIGKDHGRGNSIYSNTSSPHAAIYHHSHSFPDQNLRESPRTVSSVGPSTSNTSDVGTLSGPQFLWGSPTQSKPLKLRCTKGLSTRLTVENVVDVLQLARLCDAPDLYLKSMRFLSKEFKAVKRTEGWKFVRATDAVLNTKSYSSSTKLNRDKKMSRSKPSIYIQCTGTGISLLQPACVFAWFVAPPPPPCWICPLWCTF